MSIIDLCFFLINVHRNDKAYNDFIKACGDVENNPDG